MSVNAFNMDLNRLAKDLGIETDKVVRKVTFQLWNGITLNTPVDTGRARGNWNLSEDNADTSINKGATSVQSYSEPTGKKAIYITNSLPYIQALEKGSSKQAPTGMVEITMNNVGSSLG